MNIGIILNVIWGVLFVIALLVWNEKLELHLKQKSSNKIIIYDMIEVIAFILFNLLILCVYLNL